MEIVSPFGYSVDDAIEAILKSGCRTGLPLAFPIFRKIPSSVGDINSFPSIKIDCLPGF
jgi:hypothetical protein